MYLFFEVTALLFNVVLQTLLFALEFILQVLDSFFDGFVSIIQVLLGLHLLVDSFCERGLISCLHHLIIKIFCAVNMHGMI
jgi:hypothetical protein